MIGKIGVAVIGAILIIPLLIAAAGVSGAIAAVFGSDSSQPRCVYSGRRRYARDDADPARY